MAQFVYIDETGSTGRGAKQQPYLTLVAVLVHEDKVRTLNEGMRRVAAEHIGAFLPGFEFHGQEIWNGTGLWSRKEYSELIAAYDAAINLLDELDLIIAHSSINKDMLHSRYGGAADANAYRLALQFLLEKIDILDSQNKIVIADEAKEQQLQAIKMVADLQQWGTGEVPGRKLNTVIDSLHFVQSHASAGVQMADLVAFIIQRARRGKEGHPAAAAALSRLSEVVSAHTLTYRSAWPARKIW